MNLNDRRNAVNMLALSGEPLSCHTIVKKNVSSFLSSSIEFLHSISRKHFSQLDPTDTLI